MNSLLRHVSFHIFYYVLVPLAIVGVRILWRMFKKVKSEDWPVINGKCTFTGVEYKDGHYELRVLYSYQLPTEKFPGCGAFHKDFLNQASANLWAEVLKEKEIPVHYKADQPDKSNLMDSDLKSIVEG